MLQGVVVTIFIVYNLNTYCWLQREKKIKWGVVFISPVSRPQKDRNQTGLRLEKTGPAVRFFDFWESKTAKRPVSETGLLWFKPVWTGEFVPLTFTSKMSPRSLKTVRIWPRNKLNHTMLTKRVDFTQYYCRIFCFQPYWMFLGSFESLN